MPQGAYGAPYGAPATPDFNQAAPNFAAPGTSGTHLPDFNQPAPAYGQPTAPARLTSRCTYAWRWVRYRFRSTASRNAPAWYGSPTLRPHST